MFLVNLYRFSVSLARHKILEAHKCINIMVLLSRGAEVVLQVSMFNSVVPP